jgi:hypothetical protein
MAGDVFVVLIIFSALVMIVKASVDAIVRVKALKSSDASPEVLKAIAQAGTPFHLTALKWGLGLGCLGVGFLIIDALKLQPDQPSTWGVLTLSIATGLLSFYGLARKNLM